MNEMRGYAVIPVVDIRCHVVSHHCQVTKVSSPQVNRFVFQVGRFVPVWLHCLAFQVSRICFAQKMPDAEKGGYAKAKEVRSPAASSTASLWLRSGLGQWRGQGKGKWVRVRRRGVRVRSGLGLGLG